MPENKDFILTQLINKIVEASPACSGDAISFFVKGLTIRQYKKKELIIRSGKIQKIIGYVNSGFVRSFCVNEKGKEINNRFLVTGEFVTHYSAFITRKPSRYNFQALEPCEVILFSLEHLTECYKRYPAFERYGRLVAEDVFIKYENHLESFLFQNPMERYHSFTRHYPKEYQSISLTMLSSYLGIDRVSLSRIRRRMAKQ
jgi:CRP/FNR family transcriptional regulator, anaerobic regulatory protein